jgi:hypothetical protein
MKLRYLCACWLVLPLAQADVTKSVEPTLGRLGAPLLAEAFATDVLPAGWTRNTGALAVRDGALRASELPADHHVGAFRKAVPLQDAFVQVEFRLEGANVFHVGFDTSPGELKKKGHLFSVIVTPGGWSITEHNDKADPASKNKVHAKSPATFKAGQWHTLTIEMKGREVLARIDDLEPLRATAADFAVKKPGLVFRVGGKAGQEVVVDNVRVWRME